ncbi:MAG: PBECR2 nuclease fold domain-containing protein [Oscillospiraceae bacterium]|nr:PBECR2 nuclease fold domain-containing protein [Oscillospiraceae bacterium]
MRYIGKIDVEKYKDLAASVTTDETVITEKQLAHILSKRASTYARYQDELLCILNDPDYIFADPKHPNTALSAKRYKNTAIVVLRLSTDSPERKNSVLTMWEIKEPRLRRYILTHKIVYKKE